MNRKLFIFILFLLFSFSVGTLAYAEDKTKEETPKKEEKKLVVFRDELKRDTPQGTIKGFLEAAKDRDYEKAAKFLDLRYISYQGDKKTKTSLARKLKVIFDQKLWIDIDNVNNLLEGSSDDGLPESQEIIGVVDSVDGAYNIILQRVSVEGIPVWVVSYKTVYNIPKMYEQFGHGVLGKFMPPILLEISIFRVTAGEWISLIIILVFCFIVSIILSKLVAFILKRIKSKKPLQFFNALLWPLRWFFIIILGRTLFKIVVYSVAAKSIMKTTTLPIIISIWLLFNLINYLFNLWTNTQKNKGKREVIVFYGLIRKVLKLLILFIAVTLWLDNLGFKVTTIIAGLGVGGIAVALAAQKSIEDILGAMTLLGARPVEIGDFVKFGDKVGTIEDITLRLTKVRTLDRTLVNIPNSIFASLQLENLTKRDKIRFHPTIHLRYETTPDQIRCILEDIRKILYSHPKVLESPVRVRLVDFGTYSLECKIFAYIDTKVYREYLEVAEELNFSIMIAIKEAGSQLAIPAQNIYTQVAESID